MAMPCPTESRTLDEYKAVSNTYTNRERSGIRKRLSSLGVKIYDAVILGPRKEENKNGDKGYKSKVELEKLLGRPINGNLSDSAWGCDPQCDCNRECSCESHCSCDKQCRHCRCVDDCSCDNHKDCYCDNHREHTPFNCRCECDWETGH